MRRKEREAKAAAAVMTEGKRADYWLAQGIVVKVVNKKLLDGRYYKVKGVVERVADRYSGHVRMHSDGALVKLDQDDLETVVPQVGSTVLVLNGRCRGETATLLSIDQERFCVTAKVDGGEQRGRVLEGVEYEDICKVAK